MNEYQVLKPVRINSESYAPGQSISLSEKEPGLDLLISSGAIRLVSKGTSKQPVKSAKVDVSAKPDKIMQEAIISSKKMVTESSLKAKSILEDADKEAVAIIEDADKEAVAIIEDADKEAESIVAKAKSKASKPRKKATTFSK